MVWIITYDARDDNEDTIPIPRAVWGRKRHGNVPQTFPNLWGRRRNVYKIAGAENSTYPGHIWAGAELRGSGGSIDPPDVSRTCKQFAQMVWQNIADWCNIPPIIALEIISGVLSLHDVFQNEREKRKALHAVTLVTFWSLWKLRNEVVFRQAVPNTTKILDEIRAMAYLWVKNRAKLAALSSENWSRFEIVG